VLFKHPAIQKGKYFKPFTWTEKLLNWSHLRRKLLSVRIFRKWL